MPVAFGLGTGATNSRIDIGNWVIPTDVSYFVWVYRIGAGGGSFGRVFGRGGGSLDLNCESATLSAFGDRTAVNYHTFPVIPIGRWVPISVSGNSTTTTTPVIYMDGVLQTLTRVGTGDFWSATKTSSLQTVIGNRPSDNARVWDGYIAYFARWNAQLSDYEHKALADKVKPSLIRSNALDNYYELKNLGSSYFSADGLPYGVSSYWHDPIDNVYHPKLYFLPSQSLGDVTLTVNNISQSHSLSLVDLIQQSVLSASSLSHSQSIEETVLTQANVLSAASLSYAHSLESLSLSQSALMSVHNLVQSQLLQIISITQNNALSVLSMSHVNSISNISLSQNNAVNVSNISQSQQTDNVVLNQSNVLSAANLSHSHNVPDIVLGAGISLALGDMTHDQSLSDISLTQNHNISIDSLLQDHTLTHISLNDGDLQLVIDSLSADHTLQNLILTNQAVLNVFSLTSNQILSEVFFSILEIPGSVVHAVDFDYRVYAVKHDDRVYAVTANNRTIIIK